MSRHVVEQLLCALLLQLSNLAYVKQLRNAEEAAVRLCFRDSQAVRQIRFLRATYKRKDGILSPRYAHGAGGSGPEPCSGVAAMQVQFRG